MANTKSAKKAARQTVRRTDVNKARRSQAAKLRAQSGRGDRLRQQGGRCGAALKEAEPVLARTAQKGVVHRKTASRKVSRLAKRVGAMGAP